ncbi:MAG: NAD-dependent epimerase/dehydratase family protein [Gammaproteobacteria bacterium]
MTGATGFLGRRLIASLASSHTVFALIRSAKPTPTDTNNITWIRGNLAKRSVWRSLPPQVDRIVHLAQSMRYREFPDGALDMYQVNVAGTFHLLEYARSVGAGHFLLASTGGIYQGGSAAVKETDPVSPATFYPASKLAAEMIARPYSLLFSICIQRLFFLYGPGQTDRVIPDLVERVRAGRSIQITGQGDGLVLTPTYIDDAVDVLRAAVEEGWAGTFNVSAPYPISMRALGEAVGEALGVAPRFKLVGGNAPPPLIPNLCRLKERYDVSRFRSVQEGLRELLVIRGPLDRA